MFITIFIFDPIFIAPMFTLAMFELMFGTFVIEGVFRAVRTLFMLAAKLLMFMLWRLLSVSAIEELVKRLGAVGIVDKFMFIGLFILLKLFFIFCIIVFKLMLFSSEFALPLLPSLLFELGVGIA